MEKERYYIKDKFDGQQHYISGDEMGYLIDITDILKDRIKSEVEKYQCGKHKRLLKFIKEL